MKLTMLVALAALCPGVAAEKPDFSGAWRADGPGQEVITIDQTEENLHISGGAGDEKLDVTCNTMGRECTGTVDGEAVRVSYWYNGPMLVEMVFEGKNNERVTETRRRLSEDGRKMSVEVIQIVPPGKDPEKLVYVRDQEQAATTVQTGENAR
jgi:hypothetical protein